MSDERTPMDCKAATQDELCADALKHYDDLSTKACSWMNSIPQAIRFWFLEKPQLEQELACVRQSAETHDKWRKINYDNQLKVESQLAEAVALLPCGHHSSLLVKSVESDYQYCDLCECRQRRNDAEEMERHYKQKLDAERAGRVAAEAKVDSLMLEYCPDEMTPEQVERWAAHQQPVSPETEAAIDAAQVQK